MQGRPGGKATLMCKDFLSPHYPSSYTDLTGYLQHLYKLHIYIIAAQKNGNWEEKYQVYSVCVCHVCMSCVCYYYNSQWN